MYEYFLSISEIWGRILEFSLQSLMFFLFAFLSRIVALVDPWSFFPPGDKDSMSQPARAAYIIQLFAKHRIPISLPL